MGIVLANLRTVDMEKNRQKPFQFVLNSLRGTELPEEHPMLKTVVQLLIGVLFI
jgi:hypothetical protein